jgi:hypothetical protein
MMIKSKWVKTLILSMIFILVMPITADARHVINVPNKNIRKVKTVKITKRWYRPRAKVGGYQRQEVVGKGKKYNGEQLIAEKGKQYAFSRFAFLADGKPSKMRSYNKIALLGKNAEPQGVAIVKFRAPGTKSKHTYMFIQMSFNKGNNHRMGRIVRYDLGVLNKYVNKKGKHNKVVKALQKSKKYLAPLSSKKKWASKRRKAKKHLSKTNYKIFAAVVIGKKFRMGHGQSFSYNPKDGRLYNAALTAKHDSGNYREFNFQKISMHTLAPSKTWRMLVRVTHTVKSVGLKSRRVKTYLQLHDLTFDKGGHFYFTETTKRMQTMKNRISKYKKGGFKPGKRHYGKYRKSLGGLVTVYRGTMGSSPKKVKMVVRISNSIGTMGQGLAYSKGRLFLIYDNAFMTMPVKHLSKLTLKKINFTVLKAAHYRESEGMGITSSGRGYLIMNRFAEAVRSHGRVK